MIHPILPGATIGVLGSGQLGRMFAIAARRMGYRVHTFSPESDTPTGQIADIEINSPYLDLDRVRDFARGVSVVTFEFENVPAATARAAAEIVPVRPAGEVLHISQNRLREKLFLSQNGLPVTRFCKIACWQDLEKGMKEMGFPAVLKTAGYGYDGKGQVKLSDTEQTKRVYASLAPQELVLEEFVEFQKEVSVVGARGLDGEFAHWGVIENTHAHHILDVSIAPAMVSPAVSNQAIEITRTIMQRLDVVGLLCVEFFLTRDEQLLVNEVAPRPHNSGHLTFDACVTSQFEQQLRAVCGIPLGSTGLLRPAAMANLLGDLWENGEPNWVAACAFQEVKLHLYGKLTPKKGRKMGHLTALAATPQNAEQLVRKARSVLTSKAP
jgi:5-(carboxyamino)imidazole ribonucleotide synthase